MTLKLVTSNENKIKEFKRFGIHVAIEKGVDLPEVQGTPLEVILHKAFDAGEKRIVEDTILTVNGVEVVDIRWKIEELNDGDEVVWTTSFGHNTGQYIILYKGTIKGKIIKPNSIPDDAFGFDPYFVPEGTDKSLYELEKLGLKDKFSARVKAMHQMKTNDGKIIGNVAYIPKWNGLYQNK